MNDTHPDIEKIYKDKLMNKTGTERILMGLSMNSAARKIAENSILLSNPGISKRELKALIFSRIYINDFKKDQFDKVMCYLRKV
ncbi:MAG: hypothetical protein ABIA04_02710 [Pseudomonadota bacterium]